MNHSNNKITTLLVLDQNIHDEKQAPAEQQQLQQTERKLRTKHPHFGFWMM